MIISRPCIIIIDIISNMAIVVVDNFAVAIVITISCSFVFTKHWKLLFVKIRRFKPILIWSRTSQFRTFQLFQFYQPCIFTRNWQKGNYRRSWGWGWGVNLVTCTKLKRVVGKIVKLKILKLESFKLERTVQSWKVKSEVEKIDRVEQFPTISKFFQVNSFIPTSVDSTYQLWVCPCSGRLCYYGWIWKTEVD